MKTYPLFYALLSMFAIGCSKSDEPTGDGNGNEQEIEGSYTVVTEKNGQLSAILLNGDAENLDISSAESGFETTVVPQLVFEEDRTLTLYQKNSDCSGKVTVHNFDSDSSKSFDVFKDLGTCDLTATAITKSSTTAYVTYSIQQDSETDAYFLRAVDISSSGTSFMDLELEFKPLGLVFAKNRIFVFSLDEDISKEYKLVVIDKEAKTNQFTVNLGFDAIGILKNPNNDVIVGYENLHTTYDSQTLDFEYTNYPSDAEPNFIGSSLRHFDSSGKMYYARVSGVHSIYDRIPAVYDFDKNSSVLYAYENFLTEAQRDFEFEIENTTMVHYDEENNLLLVGYAKTGGDDKGGILRIKPIPEPKFVGNLDLDGIPLSLYIK